jgi:NADP-dependent 3-hydroxy acid dehydrogenase YdfG
MTDRVALVTGGSSGIGERTAVRLQEAGFTRYAVARRVDRMQGLVDAGVTTYAMDVTDDASMTAGVERIVGEHGRVDVLVNNAGYGSYGAVETVSIDEARRQFEVNVFGLARLTQLVLPHMRAQGSGRIVNISSIGGKFYEPLGAWYHAAKFAVEGGTSASSPDVAARKIVKAATTARPKPRYPVGRGAGSILAARRVLPDRAFDAVVSRLYS